MPPVYNQIGFGVLLIVMILVAPDGMLSIGRRLLTRKAPAAAAPARRAAITGQGLEQA